MVSRTRRARQKKRQCAYCDKVKPVYNSALYPVMRKLPNKLWACTSCMLDPKKVPSIRIIQTTGRV